MKKHLPASTRTWLRRMRRFGEHWGNSIFPIGPITAALRGYPWYFADWFRYQRLPGAERSSVLDGHPCFSDRVAATSYDTHYFYQAVWAMEKIRPSDAKWHVDIGSDVDFIGMLTTCLPVVFLDMRPFSARLPRLHSLAGDILHLPFASNSLTSLSCLHVAEHIGLGRYGDPLNPQGTRQACGELERVLRAGGNLFFSIPVGRSRVCFNAHRIHRPDQILEYFGGLQLVEFSAVDDNGNLQIDIAPEQMQDAEYACGLFWFRRDTIR